MIDYVDFSTPIFESLGGNGAYRTENLFLETSRSLDSIGPVYTLREHEVEYKGGYLPSSYQVIRSSSSEYEAAIRLLGSFRHWERLKSSGRVWSKGVSGRPAIPLKTALEDMDRRIKAEGRDILIGMAKSGNVTAAKVIAGNSEEKTSKKKEVKKEEEPVKAHLKVIENFSVRDKR